MLASLHSGFRLHWWFWNARLHLEAALVLLAGWVCWSTCHCTVAQPPGCSLQSPSGASEPPPRCLAFPGCRGGWMAPVTGYSFVVLTILLPNECDCNCSLQQLLSHGNPVLWISPALAPAPAPAPTPRPGSSSSNSTSSSSCSSPQPLLALIAEAAANIDRIALTTACQTHLLRCCSPAGQTFRPNAWV